MNKQYTRMKVIVAEKLSNDRVKAMQTSTQAGIEQRKITKLRLTR